MQTLSIGITTFRNRLDDVKQQITEIRNFDKNIPILLAITANYNEEMPNKYRKNLLRFCATHDNIYPLTFPRYTGLAKMWNNLIVHCSTSHIFIMNDDITFQNPQVLPDILELIKNEHFFIINNTFGTFVISKQIAHVMGYFDERLITYGEEDGDFRERYETTQMPYGILYIDGIINRVQNTRKDSYDSNMETYNDAWGGFKPVINKVIIEKKKEENWPNYQQYPYEKFINDNYHNIGKVGDIIM